MSNLRELGINPREGVVWSEPMKEGEQRIYEEEGREGKIVVRLDIEGQAVEVSVEGDYQVGWVEVDKGIRRMVDSQRRFELDRLVSLHFIPGRMEKFQFEKCVNFANRDRIKG